jgi:hypothetical protein
LSSPLEGLFSSQKDSIDTDNAIAKITLPVPIPPIIVDEYSSGFLACAIVDLSQQTLDALLNRYEWHMLHHLVALECERRYMTTWVD